MLIWPTLCRLTGSEGKKKLLTKSFFTRIKPYVASGSGESVLDLTFCGLSLIYIDVYKKCFLFLIYKSVKKLFRVYMERFNDRAAL